MCVFLGMFFICYVPWVEEERVEGAGLRFDDLFTQNFIVALSPTLGP